MNGWHNFATAAIVDATAAALAMNDAEILEHLRNAAANIQAAIELVEQRQTPEIKRMNRVEITGDIEGNYE